MLNLKEETYEPADYIRSKWRNFLARAGRQPKPYKHPRYPASYVTFSVRASDSIIAVETVTWVLQGRKAVYMIDFMSGGADRKLYSQEGADFDEVCRLVDSFVEK